MWEGEREGGEREGGERGGGESEKEGENEEHLECGRALCLQGCAHPLHWSERERGREIEREKEKERVRKRERERKRECLFLKGMKGALVPFSYVISL